MDNIDSQPSAVLNVSITVGIQVFAVFMLWISSHASLQVAIVTAVIFSFLMLTNYELIHQGSHGNLAVDKKVNWLLGSLAGCLFPVSLTFYQKVHLFHHLNNRSENERFECYKSNDTLATKIFRHLQWYSIVVGTYWIFIPLVCLLGAILPWVLRARPFRAIITTERMFDFIDLKSAQKITLESLLIIGYWAWLWNWLDLRLMPLGILYACFAFNWSSRQYIAHAFTPFDSATGALNLKTNSIMQLILLNSNWHLVHHKNPAIPWNKIPLFVEGEPFQSYYKQYFKLWAAPIRIEAGQEMSRRERKLEAA